MNTQQPMTYEQEGNDPDLWKRVAQSLRKVAAFLREHRGDYLTVTGPDAVHELWAELLLWGFATEAYIKCLLIKQGNSISVGTELAKTFRTHDLVRLAKQTGLVLAPTEQEILRHLTIISTWSGRYPVGANATVTDVSHYWISERDDPALDALLARIIAML